MKACGTDVNFDAFLNSKLERWTVRFTHCWRFSHCFNVSKGARARTHTHTHTSLIGRL